MLLHSATYRVVSDWAGAPVAGRYCALFQWFPASWLRWDVSQGRAGAEPERGRHATCHVVTNPILLGHVPQVVDIVRALLWHTVCTMG